VTVLVLALGWAAIRSFPLLLNQLGHGVRHLSSPPLWLRLAADSMRRHSRRSGATAISLMITVAGLVGVYGAADSYRSSLTDWLDATVSWDLKVSSGPLGAGPTTPLPAATTDVIASVAGVAAVLPERTVTVSSRGRAVPVVAFDASVEAPSRALRPESLAPGWPSGVAGALEAPETVALSTALAARLGVSAGERLPLTTAVGETEFLVVAVVEEPAVDGASTHAAAAYVDIGRFAESWNDGSVDEIGVRLDEGVDPGRAAMAVTAAVRSALGHARTARGAPALDPGHVGDAAAALPVEAHAAVVEDLTQSLPVQVVQATAYREEVLEEVRDTFLVIRTLVLVALLVALAGLLNAILIGFWQLRHQLGLLRALGAPVRLLARTLAAEAALTTIAGGGAGVLLGTLLSIALLRGMDSTAGPLLVWSPPVQAYVTVATLLAVASIVAGSVLDNRARATQVQAVVRGE
jgi:putative ABC transport system permease protein